MLILGIETSCDETSASLVDNGTKLLSLVTATSQDMHQKYGGIIPDKAAREQLKVIIPVIEDCLATSHQQPATIDAIAVTYGPGLIGSLLIGVETAKTLALAWNKPIIPVNHLLGHIYANWLTSGVLELSYPTPAPDFPALVLIVSGGHSDLVLMQSHSDINYLGGTIDDAAGECFDKCGRLLGLPYPYGPYIGTEAEKFSLLHSPPSIKLPRPLISSHDFNFSFSGLKTAFLHAYEQGQKNHQPSDIFKQALAYELQESVTDVLVTKTLNAAQHYKPKSVLLAGGVAANHRLREKLHSQFSNLDFQTEVYIPPLKLCTDNAAVIASAAYFHQTTLPIDKVNANPSLTVTSRLTD